MKKISVSNVIKFIRKGDRSRVAFIANLKKPKVKTDDSGGGNYWMCSTSTISQVFKSEELSELEKKIQILVEKKRDTPKNVSKGMYQKNIDILYNAKDFDYSELKPYFDIEYLKNTNVILELNTVPVQIIPNHVFKFQENAMEKVGAIWIVANIKTYKKEELAVFAYSLFQYLKRIYEDKYQVSEDYCIVLDVTTSNVLSYKQAADFGHLNFVHETLAVIKKMI
ncbi:hypothetical protein [Pedobacter nototheniae]|uniref:hypothetical protein n=1 Tax=Pedobacter nototheniae TaxID=2488994 RepID=UPI00103BA34D|nr:hypothetical protein [Pedobacter nototheniae]